MADTSIYKNIRGFQDYNEAAQAQGLQKALLAAQIAGQQQDREIKRKQLEQGVDAPAAVREYQFYEQLDPVKQEQFLNVKRAAQIQNLGGAFGVYNPVQGGITNIAGGDIAPTPAQQADLDAKAREAEDLFNRGLDVKQKALDTVDRLLGNVSGVRAASGSIGRMIPNISESAYNAEVDLENLSNLLTTENLGLLKGVLSDTDMRVLASIGAGELKGSDKKVLGALRKMRGALAGKVAAGRAVQEQGFEGLPPLLSDPNLDYIDTPQFGDGAGNAVAEQYIKGQIYTSPSGQKAIYTGTGFKPVK